MIDREVIVPPTMQRVVERAGYAPAVRVGATVYCAGQVGRTPELDVIADPEAQFLACWDNLRTVLEAAGCTFDDVVDMTTYHVGLSRRHIRRIAARLSPQCTVTDRNEAVTALFSGLRPGTDLARATGSDPALRQWLGVGARASAS